MSAASILLMMIPFADLTWQNSKPTPSTTKSLYLPIDS
jgi:hypothetical protein